MKKLIGFLVVAALIIVGAQVLRRHRNNPLVSPAEKQTLRDAPREDPCACPGPGCPDGGIPPGECLKKDGKNMDKDACPDPSCAKLPVMVTDKECPCPGPGCPAGGWFSYGVDLNDPKVSRCYQKALEITRKNLQMCRRIGHCGKGRKTENSSAPPLLLDDKECPCPGPGCPDGGWFFDDTILKDPKVSRCYQKALRLQTEKEARRKKMQKDVNKVLNSGIPGQP